MIAERIFNGDTAEDIGLTEDQYASRKETLDRYLATTGGSFIPAGYLEWLTRDEAGNRGEGTAISAPGFRKCCDEKKQMPSAAKMGITLAREMVSFAKAGFKTVSSEEARRRMDICKRCEHYTGKRCLKCGCFMAAKTKMATTACPIGKWHRHTEA